MQEFPDQVELQILVGLRVSSLVFHPFSVEIIFDDSSSLVCEHCIEYTPQKGETETLDIQKGFVKTSVHRIVDHQIVGIRRNPFLLCIDFDDGQELRVISVPGSLESGHLSLGGAILVF